MNEYINNFDHKFGHENKLLCDIVRYCLEVNEHERFTAHELLDRIECYGNVDSFLRAVTEHVHPAEVHHEPRTEVCVEQARPTVCHGERRPVAVYKIVNGERVLIEGTPV